MLWVHGHHHLPYNTKTLVQLVSKPMEFFVLFLKRWTLRALVISLPFFILFLGLDGGRWPSATLLPSRRTAVGTGAIPPLPAGIESAAAPAPAPQLPTLELLSPQPSSDDKPLRLKLEPPSPKPSATLVFSPPPAVRPTEEKCNIFEGRWVYDRKNYPLYRARSCPALSEQVRCLKNGRPDSDYEHWRWEPKACKLPTFSRKRMLELLRGKRVVIVGDSLNRNQWESLVCLLYGSVRRKRSYIRVTIDYRIFKALDYQCSVEFFMNPFLIKEEEEKNGKKVLKLDKLPAIEWRWRGANLIIFNSGHWWIHHGRLKTWDYYEYKGEKVDMEEGRAYEVAMHTWAHWVDKFVDPSKTIVFFRSISPEHKLRNLQWCYNQTRPITRERYKQTFSRSMLLAVERTIRSMRTPIRYLNITWLSEYRRDAHTSVYTTRKGKLLTGDQQKQPSAYADCSHWCLPGVPDTWNLLLFASIVGLPSNHL